MTQWKRRPRRPMSPLIGAAPGLRQGMLRRQLAWDGTCSAERLGYPTQKPLPLLERIIRASGNAGAIIFEPVQLLQR
jgi:hypothetical protein